MNPLLSVFAVQTKLLNWQHAMLLGTLHSLIRAIPLNPVIALTESKKVIFVTVSVVPAFHRG